jgi:hypothetical protein
MKKYVLTNEAGDTGTGVKIKAGKYVHDAAQHTALLSRLTSCAETAGLAALVSPIVPKDVCLYQVHSWNVSVGDPKQAQNYTIIKEIPTVPRVTLEIRMVFALRALMAMTTHPEFRTWADNWISNTNRSRVAIAQVRKVLEGEHLASEELEVLAAWGASSSDDLNTVHKLEEQTQRALHIVRAAELAEDGASQAEAMAVELAKGLEGIVQESNKRELQNLVAELLDADLIQEPDQDEDAITG